MADSQAATLYTILVRFLQELDETFPEENDIKKTIEIIQTTGNTRPRLVLDIVYDTIVNYLKDAMESEPTETEVCGFCKESLRGNQVTLECTHTCHLQCLVIDVAACHQLDRRSKCNSCNAEIVSADTQVQIFAKADEIDRRLTNNPQTVIDNLFETSEDFKNEIKEIKQKRKEMGSARALFVKKKNELYTVFKEKINTMLMILKGTHKDAVKEVLNTEEYKNASKTSRLYINSIHKLSRKYDVSSRILYGLIHGRRQRTGRYIYNYPTTYLKWEVQKRFRIKLL